MRLVDLDPRWLLKDGKRIGIIFVSPTDARWRQTCFFEATPFKAQCRAVWDAMKDMADEDGEYGQWQPCRTFAWTIAGGAESASFETMSITPSIDGSAGGLWHGYITNGEIR